MAQPWSEQIEQRYALRLSPELRAWLDDEIWRWPAAAEFRYPLHPEEILDPQPGLIWAGFMLPDTLPLVGNEYGDWLCLRVLPDGGVQEILCWNHGGGDWIPYGRGLAEALLYDAAYASASDNPRRVAAVAESDSLERSTAQWACQWLSVRGGVSDSWSHRGAAATREHLLEAGVAEVVIRRDRALAFLNSPLKAGSDPDLARHMNVRWDPEFVRWIFDTDLIPLASRDPLAGLFNQPLEQLLQQDWAGAECEALAVLRLRQDLGWAFDVAGWAAERREDMAGAVRFYVGGLRTSLFADETVRFRTHWFPEGYGKFAAARLVTLREHLSDDLLRDPYLQLFWQNDADSLRTRLRDYWLQRARQHYRCAQYLQAFHCFYRAGWDCGLSDLDGYAEILDGLGASAAAAGALALANVVETHRRFLPA